MPSSDPKPVSILFVCLGNICRSPMAEGVFRSLAASHPSIARIDSAGTGAYHAGDNPERDRWCARAHAGPAAPWIATWISSTDASGAAR